MGCPPRRAAPKTGCLQDGAMPGRLFLPPPSIALSCPQSPSAGGAPAPAGRPGKKTPEKILRNIVQSGSIVTMMRTLALYSLQELSTVRELDTPVRPSQITKDGLKIPAVRKPAANVAKKFEQLILRQMARSAFALARMWDIAYIRSGRPDLSLAQNYRFPHTPKFVWPDYLK